MLGLFFTDVFGVQGLRGVTWNHLMPPLCRVCCGRQRHHQGWAALAGLGTSPVTGVRSTKIIILPYFQRSFHFPGSQPQKLPGVNCCSRGCPQ